MSGFSTTLPGVGEARLTAIRDYLRTKVSDLNLTLQLTPLSLPTGSAASGNIIIGDPSRIDRTDRFKLCVLGGGRDQGLDLEVKLARMGVGFTTSSFENTLHSRLRLYLSPFEFPVSATSVAQEELQASNREIFLQRITDWLRADCFQVRAGVQLTLASKEYGNPVTVDNPTGGDFLQQNVIVATTVGRFTKGYGNAIECHGADIQIMSTCQ